MRPLATIITIQPDGAKLVQQHDPSKWPKLRLLQKLVGGHIQSVDFYLPEGKRAYANEEGILKKMEPNLEGSGLVLWPGVPLVGPVVILEGFVVAEEEEE